MKYIIACLFGLGLIFESKAQVPDSSSGAPSFTCHYIDENSFQCDRTEGKGMSKEDWTRNEGNTSTERDRKFNPEEEGSDREEGSEGKDRKGTNGKTIKDKYSQPEKESDTGILGADDYGDSTSEANSSGKKWYRSGDEEGYGVKGRENREPAPSEVRKENTTR